VQQSLVTRQEMSVRMIPEQIVASTLLRMNAAELSEHVESELEENPALDMTDKSAVEVLPGNTDENRRTVSDIAQRMRVTGIESNYLMIARIKSIEVYDDTGMKNKIGSVETDPFAIGG
jgi:DNA-directed RNA polymerase specialized sigma54-like protein